CNQVVVTSRAFMVRSRLGWRRVAWSEVEAIEASRAFWGRLILGVRYRNTSGGRRWLAASHYSVQGGYDEVLRALVSVARSDDHRGQVKLAPWVAAEASRSDCQWTPGFPRLGDIHFPAVQARHRLGAWASISRNRKLLPSMLTTWQWCN